MYLEHLIYSSTLAILCGMVYYKLYGRDPSWIIIISAFVPDLDLIVTPLFQISVIRLFFYGHLLHHGDFHTLGSLILYAMILSLVLLPFGIRFLDAFIFGAIGFAAHLFEDSLVYGARDLYLWPITIHKVGIKIFDYHRDWFGAADASVLVIGVILLLIAAIIRTHFEGRNWTRHYIPNMIFK